MSRSGHPLPPGDVRLLAACSHLGFYIGYALVAWIEIWRGIYPPPRELHPGGGWSTAANVALAVTAMCGPPVAALWAARTSPWHGFLRSHGLRALSFHAGTALAALVMALVLYVVPFPGGFVVVVAVWVVGTAWVILPVGAAFRARDGDLAWYPFVRRLLPDPPVQGWRTPLPPGPP